MRDEINKKIDSAYGFESFVSKEPIPERDQPKKDFDLRTYAKVIFEDGTPEERMIILRAMRGKVLLKDKRLYMDTVTVKTETVS